MQNAANIPIILSFEICSDSAGLPRQSLPVHLTGSSYTGRWCSDHSSSEGKSTATMDSKYFNWFKRFNILIHPSSSIYILISEMIWTCTCMYMLHQWPWNEVDSRVVEAHCRGSTPQPQEGRSLKLGWVHIVVNLFHGISSHRPIISHYHPLVSVHFT